MKKISKKKEQELTDYLRAWKEATCDLFTDEATMNQFLEHKKRQFFNTK
jgi:hypothetical protein